MHVTVVHIRVKPGSTDDFIAATRRNHEGSTAEPGNLRFDFLQHAEDPTRFMLYEAYRTAEDAAAHKSTPHYLAWRIAVDGLMAETRVGTRWNPLAPSDPERW